MPSDTRKRLRDLLLGAPTDLRKILLTEELEEIDPTTGWLVGKAPDPTAPLAANEPPPVKPVAAIEVRAPTWKQRASVQEASGLMKALTARAAGEDVSFDYSRQQLESVLALTFVVETGKPLFEPADINAFLEAPTTSPWLDKLAGYAQRMMNEGVEQKKRDSKPT